MEIVLRFIRDDHRTGILVRDMELFPETGSLKAWNICDTGEFSGGQGYLRNYFYFLAVAG
jgi:hypothetical protein